MTLPGARGVARRFRLLAKGVGWADQHLVAAVFLVAWAGCLLSSSITNPAQVFAPEHGQARPALFDERWAFYTRAPDTTVITIDKAGPGQSLNRSERERTVELRLLESQFPIVPDASPITIKGRSGMLICGQTLLARRVHVTAKQHAPAVGQVLWQQLIHVSC